jgi:threonine dehydrogenase-like Zn-dependent dehydrogenase
MRATIMFGAGGMEASETGQSMGHEAIGIVEEVGAEVLTLQRGDVVVMPFAFSDGTCAFCHEGLHTACVHVGFFGNNGMNGAQAEALRVPYADGTLSTESLASTACQTATGP